MTAKIKPVMAWGIVKNGVLVGYAYKFREIAASNWTDVKLVRVRITPVTPKRKVKR